MLLGRQNSDLLLIKIAINGERRSEDVLRVLQFALLTVTHDLGNINLIKMG